MLVIFSWFLGAPIAALAHDDRDTLVAVSATDNLVHIVDVVAFQVSNTVQGFKCDSTRLDPRRGHAMLEDPTANDLVSVFLAPRTDGRQTQSSPL